MDNIKELLLNHDPEIVLTGLDQLTYFFNETLANEILGDTHFDDTGSLIFSESMLQIPAEVRTRVALFLMANLEHESLQQQTKLMLFEHELNPCPSFSLPHVEKLIWSVNMLNDTIEVVEDTVWDLNNLTEVGIYDSNLTPSSRIKSDWIDLHTAKMLRGGLSRIPYIEAENLKTLKCSPSWSMEGLESYEGIQKLVFGCMLDGDSPIHSSFTQRDEDADIDILNNFFEQNELIELVISRISNRCDDLTLPLSLEKLTLGGRIESLKIVENLANLTSLVLFDCPNLIDLSALFQLPQLKQLRIAFGFSSLFPITGSIWKNDPHSQITLEDKTQVARFLELLQFFYDCHHERNTMLPNQGDILYLGDNKLLSNFSTVTINQGHHNIKEINLRHASSLLRIDLPEMPHIKKVDLSNCAEFSELQSLACFPNVEVLILKGCVKLQNLDDLPELKHLSEIDLSSTRLSNIDGIQKCPNIRIFKAEHAHQISDLRALEKLRALEHIFISDNSIQHLQGLQTAEQLKTIDLYGSLKLKNLNGLPNIEMQSISLINCPLLYSLAGMPQLTSKEIEIINNDNLKDIEGLTKSTQLESISFQGCTALHNIFPLQNLPNLKTLKLGTPPYEDQRPEIITIDTPESFIRLYEKNRADYALFGQVDTYREELKNRSGQSLLDYWDKIVAIENKYFYRKLLEGSKILPSGEFSMWNEGYSNYKDFILFQLYSMAEHPDFIHAETINLRKAHGLTNLDALKNAQNLKELYVESESLTDISGLREVPAFTLGSYKSTGLMLTNCPKLQDFSPLKDLNIQWFWGMNNPHPVDFTLLKNAENGRGLYQINLARTNLENLADFQKHTNLVALELQNCTNLVSLEGFHGNGTEIIRVLLEGCVKLTSLHGLQGIGQRHDFEKLTLTDCSSLTDISALQDYIHEHLNFTGCNSLEDISVLATCSHLQQLNFNQCNSLKDISPLKGHPTLERLLAQNTSIQDISVLPTIANLKKVTITTDHTDVDLKYLSQCPALEQAIVLSPKQSGHDSLSTLGHLKVLGCHGLSDLSLLPESETIESLYLYSSTTTHLNDIGKLPNLKLLYLNDSNQITDFSGINQLTKLETLNLPNNSPTLQGLSSHLLRGAEIKSLLQSIQLVFNLEQGLKISESPDILSLKMQGKQFVSDLQFIQKLPNLKELDIRNCNNITTLDGLQYHPCLEEVLLDNCSNLRDLSALSTLYRLKVSSLSISAIDIEDLNSLKDLLLPKEKKPVPQPNIEVRKWLSLARIRTFDLDNTYRSTNHCSKLSINTCSSLRDISAIYDTEITELNVNNCVHIESMDALLGLRETLTKLDARHVQFDLDFSNFTKLEHLLIRGNHEFRHFHTLYKVRRLDTLSIGPNKFLTNLDFLQNLTQLRFLAITDISSINDISGLRFFNTESRQFDAYKYNTELELHFYDDSSEHLPQLPVGIHVERISIYNWPNITNLDALLQVSGVKELYLQNIPKVTDISALLLLPELQKLTIHSVGHLEPQTLTSKSEIQLLVEQSQNLSSTITLQEFEVLLHDNSVTTVDEVIDILQVIFKKTYEPHQIMRDISKTGVLSLGKFTYASSQVKMDKWKQYKQKISSVLEIEWKELELDFEAIIDGINQGLQISSYEDVNRLLQRALLNIEENPTSGKHYQLQKVLSLYSEQNTQEDQWEPYITVYKHIIETYKRIYGDSDVKTIECQISYLLACLDRLLFDEGLKVSSELIKNLYNEDEPSNQMLNVINIHSIMLMNTKQFVKGEKWAFIALHLAERLHSPSLDLFKLNIAWVYLQQQDARCLPIIEEVEPKLAEKKNFLKYWPSFAKSIFTSMQTQNWTEPQMILDNIKRTCKPSEWRMKSAYRWIDKAKNISAANAQSPDSQQ